MGEDAFSARYTCRFARVRAFGPRRAPEEETPLEEVRRSLKTQQHAHLSIDPRSRSVSRFDAVERRSPRGSVDGGAKIDPVAPGEPSVYIGLPAVGVRPDLPRQACRRLFVKFFTESLILAQDERWRRA